jgi:hypothetical protein
MRACDSVVKRRRSGLRPTIQNQDCGKGSNLRLPGEHAVPDDHACPEQCEQ